MNTNQARVDAAVRVLKAAGYEARAINSATADIEVQDPVARIVSGRLEHAGHVARRIPAGDVFRFISERE